MTTTTARLMMLRARHIILSHCHQPQRRNASALPIRHSRHAPPPACLDAIQLKEESQQLLEASPGTLIPYDTPSRDDALHAWQVADHAIQKVEWLMRGYSAQVKDSQMQVLYDGPGNADAVKCVTGMTELLDKMDKEGKLYMDLRRKMRSQLAVEGQEYQRDSLPNLDQSSARLFASPGQSIAMFDVLLDTMAVSANGETPGQVGELLKRINSRYEDDGGHEINVNPNTVMTQMTFNAALRAIANTPANSGDKARDDAIMHAFVTFEGLRHFSSIRRNAATYTYMIQIVSKFIPPSEMSGNVAHGLWNMAQDAQVIDNNVMRAMELIHCGAAAPYEKFETFMDGTIRGKDIYGVPQKWTKFGRAWRHNKDDDTY